jgi:hypothetical protein
MIDYLEYYQDDTDEQMREQLTLLEEVISQFPVKD